MAVQNCRKRGKLSEEWSTLQSKKRRAPISLSDSNYLSLHPVALSGTRWNQLPRCRTPQPFCQFEYLFRNKRRLFAFPLPASPSSLTPWKSFVLTKQHFTFHAAPSCRSHLFSLCRDSLWHYFDEKISQRFETTLLSPVSHFLRECWSFGNLPVRSPGTDPDLCYGQSKSWVTSLGGIHHWPAPYVVIYTKAKWREGSVYIGKLTGMAISE